MPLPPLERINIEALLNPGGIPTPGIFQGQKEQLARKRIELCQNKFYRLMVFERMEQTPTTKQTGMEEYSYNYHCRSWHSFSCHWKSYR